MTSCCAAAAPGAPTPEVDLTHFVRHLPSGVEHIDFTVDGITCAACIGTIEKGLASIPELTRARVNLTNRRLAVEWKGAFDPARVVARMRELGFQAFPFGAASAESEQERQSQFLLRCLGVAAFAAMNVMLMSVAVWSGNVSDIGSETRDFFHWFSAVIALPAAAYAGQPFFRSAWAALRARRLNMDVPISLGVILALAMSVVETANHAEHAYFDAALMLLTFLLAGRFLEQKMRLRTLTVATNLAALKAPTATKVIGDSELRDVPVASLDPGDIVLVRPGQRIGVDGVVIAGHSDIDQSLVTGETLPAAVNTGASVYAGTLNLTGLLRIKVIAAESGTLLDEISRLLDNAAQSKSRYVRLADRAAQLYSPAVHITALATLIGWLAFGASLHDAVITAIAVLIITCPCALGLAIPAVQVVASGALFRSGLLLNSGDAIERLATADTVIFDKTGTLTLPEPQIVNIADIPPPVARIAGQLAMASHHPLARVLATALGAHEPAESVTELPGQGVQAQLKGEFVRLGSPAFCGAEEGSKRAAAIDPDASQIAVAVGAQKYVFRIRQTLRSDASATLARLKKLGLETEIVSGDRVVPVESVARTLDVPVWAASLSPRDKIGHIETLKYAGHNVLMVGDGLNDAPALAAASVSIAPVTATQLTQAQADVVFLGEQLGRVATAIALARKAFTLMRQNLWIAVIYNAVAVPLAISGHITPLIAAAAMSGSSIIVTANALRARKAEGV